MYRYVFIYICLYVYFILLNDDLYILSICIYIFLPILVMKFGSFIFLDFEEKMEYLKLMENDAVCML